MPTNNKTLKVCILRTTEGEWGINTIGWKKQKDFFQKMMAKGNNLVLLPSISKNTQGTVA